MRTPNLKLIGIESPHVSQQAFASALHGQARWLPRFVVGHAIASADWALSIANSQVVNQARHLDAELGDTMAAVSPYTVIRPVSRLLAAYADLGTIDPPAVRVGNMRPLLAEHGYYSTYNDKWSRFPSVMERQRAAGGDAVAAAMHGWLEERVRGYDGLTDERMEGGSLSAAITRNVLEIQSTSKREP